MGHWLFIAMAGGSVALVMLTLVATRGWYMRRVMIGAVALLALVTGMVGIADQVVRAEIADCVTRPDTYDCEDANLFTVLVLMVGTSALVTYALGATAMMVSRYFKRMASA